MLVARRKIEFRLTPLNTLFGELVPRLKRDLLRTSSVVFARPHGKFLTWRILVISPPLPPLVTRACTLPADRIG